MDTATQRPAKPRRRWFRFRLRTRLILVTVLTVLLGWIGWRLEQVRNEQATVNWIERMGWFADQSWFSGKVRRVSLNHKFDQSLRPLAVLKNLEGLSLGDTEVSDLSPLAEVKSLESLRLRIPPQVSDLSPWDRGRDRYRAQVSDLSPLAELKSLRTLDLRMTYVRDLSPLAELKNLKTLDLGKTRVSDLSPLTELKNLKTLVLLGKQVSDEQVQELKQALPNLEIIWRVDQPPAP